MLTYLFFGGLIIFILFICLYVDTLEQEVERLKKQSMKDDCERIVKLCEEILKKNNCIS